jgi:hypothetical protein
MIVGAGAALGLLLIGGPWLETENMLEAENIGNRPPANLLNR